MVYSESMTRIVAGAWGGRKLLVPTQGTRPTSEKVREAVFSHLESRGVIEDARVLDLCSGSGALGLESLSRGGHSADFVEKSPAAARTLRANVSALQTLESCQIFVSDARKFLLRASQESRKSDSLLVKKYDLVFIDPPYGQANSLIEQLLPDLLPLLANAATVVLETAVSSSDWEIPAGLELYGQKSYGDTLVTYLVAS